MVLRRFVRAAAAAIVLACGASVGHSGDSNRKLVPNYVVPDAAVVGPMEPTALLHLAIGLPPPDPEALRAFADAVSDPKSRQFRRFLTLEQLTERFGPSAADYQALIDWARSNRLIVEQQYPRRLLLVVQGAAADVERALAVKLFYARRADGSTFHKPDRVPSLDAGVKIAFVAGVDTLFLPRIHQGGSQENGAAFDSGDLRGAFANECLGLTGAGQSVGIMAYATYLHSDVSDYETAARIDATMACGASTPGSAPCLNDVPLLGFTGPGSTPQTEEATADVELAIAMAPGLHQVSVFQADSSLGCVGGDAIIAAMAAATDVKQFSTSVSYCQSDNTAVFEMMASSGQSFFGSSGDDGTSGFTENLQNKVTDVGGTTLEIVRPHHSIIHIQRAWYCSGGGVEAPPPNFTSTCPANCTPGAPGCTNNCIPPWQQGVANAQNGASSTYRNEPDIAMPAQNLFAVFNGQNSGWNGTSASAPLMAGFLALVNEQQCLNEPSGCANGGGGMGFVSPALYQIGFSPLYGKAFFDIVGTSPSQTCTASAPAVSGYNLATGWGTPACGLIDQLTCTTCTNGTAAPGALPSLSCVSFRSDPQNCGSCGNVCAAGLVCSAGNCTHRRAFK